MRRRGSPSRPGVRTRGLGGSLVWAAAILLLLLFAFPVGALVARTAVTGTVLAALLDPAVGEALLLSLATTAVALGLAILLGTPLAWLLARHRFRGQRVIETLVDLPLVLPPAVAGLALLLLVGRRGPLGAPLATFGIELPFSTAAVIVAQLFVAAPLYVRGARAGLAAVPRDLEDAARADGASEWGVFRRVTAPLASGAITAGAISCWGRALGEFGATILFAGNVAGRTQTLPLLVYAEFQSSLDAAVAAAAILVLAAIAILLGARLTPRLADIELAATT